jgi:hypothetical protein
MRQLLIRRPQVRILPGAWNFRTLCSERVASWARVRPATRSSVAANAVSALRSAEPGGSGLVRRDPVRDRGRLSWGREVDPRTLGEQLELPEEGLRSDPRRHRVRIAQRGGRLGA